jgi:hypothetical protein
MTTVLDALTACWAWVLAHPTYAWPLISALVTIALKPRTPEQYAAMAAMRPVWFWSRFAPLLQLVGALGLDPVKALAVLSKVFTGKQDSTGRPPMGGLVVVLAIGLAVGTSACASFQKVTPYLPTPDQIACAELEADKGTPVLGIITSCGFAQDAFEIVEHLVIGHQKAKAMRAAAALDGGVRTLNFANDNDAGRTDAGKVSP